MDAALYHAKRSRSGVAPLNPARDVNAGPALTRDAALFQNAVPGAPVLSAAEKLEILRKYVKGGETGLGSNYGRVRLQSLIAQRLAQRAAAAAPAAPTTPAAAASMVNTPAPAPVTLPSTPAPQPSINLPQPYSAMPVQVSPYVPPPAPSFQPVDLSTINLPAPAPQPLDNVAYDTGGYNTSVPLDMPSPAMTVPAMAPDVNAPSAYTQDSSAGITSVDSYGFPVDVSTSDTSSSGYDYTGSGGLMGMGADPTAPATPSWSDTLQNVLTAATGVWQQKKLADINLTRAQQGLPPISASDAGVGVQATVGLDRSTRNMIIMGVVGLGIAGALVYAARGHRR